MKAYARMMTVLVAGGALAAPRANAQQVHEIQMAADDEGGFGFTPSTVSAKRGDVLLFKAASGSPHSVVFEGKELSPAARQALNGAMPRRAGDLSSPLLKEGAEYRVVVPALPAGSYKFFCLPHRAYDMRGVLTVQ